MRFLCSEPMCFNMMNTLSKKGLCMSHETLIEVDDDV